MRLLVGFLVVTAVMLPVTPAARAGVPEPATATALAASAHVPVVPGVTVLYEPCPGYPELAGCTWPGQDVVYVLDPADRYYAYHELGHVFDYHALGRGGERKFARLTRHAHEPGIDGMARTWGDIGEQFADAYATCAFGWRPRPGEWGDLGHRFPTGYGYDPSPHVQRQVCALIVRAGRRAGLA